MVIKKDWTFNELVKNVERLKQEYIFFLAFFSFDNNIETIKNRNDYIRKIRTEIYKVNIKEWQIDMCWEYMNDYLEYPVLYEKMIKIEKKAKKW